MFCCCHVSEYTNHPEHWRRHASAGILKCALSRGMPPRRAPGPLAEGTRHSHAVLAPPDKGSCWSSLRLLQQVDAVSCIVAGTENKHIMILNSSGTAVAKTIWLGAVPAFLAGSGLLDVSYVLAVASRDSKIYIIRNGELTSSVIQLDSQPLGLVSTLLDTSCEPPA